MRLNFRRKKCPKCNAPLIPIIYGFPSPKMLAAVTEGHAKLGGCVIGPERVFCGNCDEKEQAEEIEGDSHLRSDQF